MPVEAEEGGEGMQKIRLLGNFPRRVASQPLRGTLEYGQNVAI